MMLVRHGFMIVGDPLGGKTSVYQVLAGALGDLHKGRLLITLLPTVLIIHPGDDALQRLRRLHTSTLYGPLNGPGSVSSSTFPFPFPFVISCSPPPVQLG